MKKKSCACVWIEIWFSPKRKRKISLTNLFLGKWKKNCGFFFCIHNSALQSHSNGYQIEYNDCHFLFFVWFMIQNQRIVNSMLNNKIIFTRNKWKRKKNRIDFLHRHGEHGAHHTPWSGVICRQVLFFFSMWVSVCVCLCKAWLYISGSHNEIGWFRCSSDARPMEDVFIWNLKS